MTGINDLPIELYELILKNNLSINDLFNCRLVNKKFKFATYECVQKLVIGNLDEFDNDNWFYNDELINYDQIISIQCLKEIRSKSIFNLDQSLKYLRINFYSNYNYMEFDEQLSNLNDFTNLECLEVHLRDGYCVYDLKLNINLNNLKYFKLFKLNVGYLNCSLKLNAPKLKKIQFFQMNHRNEQQILIENNPESIRHLITENYEDQLKIFCNLEILELTNVSNLNENLLSFFSNLKQLEIKIIELTNSLKECLIKILNKRKESKKDIDIYFNGVKIINTNKLVEYESYGRNILKFQLDNYNRLKLNPLENFELDYFKLTNYYNLRNGLPSFFFNKYPNILDVCVYDEDYRIDAGHLNWFLNKLKYLKVLKINAVLLDQVFFNNLPITIRQLSINDFSSSRSLYLNINFNFVLKFTKLIHFFQNGWNIDLFNLALVSFSNLKYFKIFTFFYKDKNLRIIKEDKLIYRFYFNKATCIKLDYDQLVKKCNEFRSK